MVIDKSNICEKYFARIGRPCIIRRTDNSETNVLAVIEMVWRRSKSRFESEHSPIGEVMDDYYIYNGPASVDITKLTIDDTIFVDDKAFYFVRADKIAIGDKVQFYTGVLKRVYEVDEDVFG